MGMNRIDPAFFNQVVLSDGKISSIDFPCRIVGGRVVPDLSKATTAINLTLSTIAALVKAFAVKG